MCCSTSPLRPLRHGTHWDHRESSRSVYLSYQHSPPLTANPLPLAHLPTLRPPHTAIFSFLAIPLFSIFYLYFHPSLSFFYFFSAPFPPRTIYNYVFFIPFYIRIHFLTYIHHIIATLLLNRLCQIQIIHFSTNLIVH